MLHQAISILLPLGLFLLRECTLLSVLIPFTIILFFPFFYLTSFSFHPENPYFRDCPSDDPTLFRPSLERVFIMEWLKFL